MNRNRRYIIFGLLIISGLLVTISGSWVKTVMAYGLNLHAKVRIFTAIIETIEKNYVEEQDPNELLDDAIRGMLQSLDPHCTYMPPDHFNKWNEDFDGYSGIGISYDIINDKITVMGIMEDGPSDRAGLRMGDKIVKVDGKNVEKIDRAEAKRRLMGRPGTDVSVTVQRPGFRKPRHFNIRRDHITVKSVRDVMMLDPQVGYLRLDRFSASTAAELDEALDELRSQGMRGLLMDFRGNGGGYLSASVDVADRFVEGGRRIVYTRGRTYKSKQEYQATDYPTRPRFPLIILIDHGTASAAEIVAGAVQDWDRGLIAGKTSFGKGLVQSRYRFHDGSALLLTTARYYTPAGRLIQRPYGDRTRDQYYEDAYVDRTAIPQEHRPRFKTNAGRIVYGGGGITPDIWIDDSEDTLSTAVRELYYSDKRYFHGFVDKFIQEHPDLRDYEEEFIRYFKVDDVILEDLQRAVNKAGGVFTREELRRSATDLRFLLKRELAYMLWGNKAKFLVNLKRDTQLTSALTHMDEAARLLERGYLQD